MNFQRIWKLPIHALFGEAQEKVLFAVILKTEHNPDFYLEIQFKEKSWQQSLAFEIKAADKPEAENAVIYELSEEVGLTPQEMLTFDRVQAIVAPGKKGLEETYNFLLTEVELASRLCMNAVEKDPTIQEKMQAPLAFLETLQEDLENLRDAFLEAHEEE